MARQREKGREREIVESILFHHLFKVQTQYFWPNAQSVIRLNVIIDCPLSKWNAILNTQPLNRTILQLIFSHFCLFPTDTYDIFIDSGGSPDAYLSSADINSFLNDSFTFNGTVDTFGNGTFFTHEHTIDNRSSTTNATDEDVAELVIMAVTSIVLGLMILITVIGKYSLTLSPSDTHTQNTTHFVQWSEHILFVFALF